MFKEYMGRFAGRLLICAAFIYVYLKVPGAFTVLASDYSFVTDASPLQILWLVWVMDMLFQLIPLRRILALGTLRQFKSYHKVSAKVKQKKELLEYRRDMARAAAKVVIAWLLLTAVLGALYFMNILRDKDMLLTTVLFYVSDLVCILFWCPFQHFFMKNRCCTVCRIFNWDHLMMFSPLVFLGGAFCRSLVIFSAVVVVMWELRFYLYPERFWDETNDNLKCANCTDHLCAAKGKYVCGRYVGRQSLLGHELKKRDRGRELKEQRHVM